MNKGQLWIEWTDADGGNEGSARWGSPVTDEQINEVIEFAQRVMGRNPDTIA